MALPRWLRDMKNGVMSGVSPAPARRAARPPYGPPAVRGDHRGASTPLPLGEGRGEGNRPLDCGASRNDGSGLFSLIADRYEIVR